MNWLMRDITDQHWKLVSAFLRESRRADGRLEGVLWALAEDLLARGQLDLEESSIDASFVGAKKGALQLVRRSAAKGARSWQSQTAMVFLSPHGLRALRRMSANWSKRRSSIASSPPSPRE